MPESDSTVTTPPKPAGRWPGPQDWTEEDLEALFASDTWFLYAPYELLSQHAGQHVAIVGERIVAGHPNFEELGHVLDAMATAGTIVPSRALFRYIPSAEESIRRGYY